MFYFSSGDVRVSVRRSAKSLAAAHPELSHCQRLTLVARGIGVDDYTCLDRNLKSTPSGRIFDRWVRAICATRLPDLREEYCRFCIESTREGVCITFFSLWLGRDRWGNDIRVPDIVKSVSVQHAREFDPSETFVLATAREIFAWRDGWLGRAFIPSKLAEEIFPRYFDRSGGVAFR